MPKGQTRDTVEIFHSQHCGYGVVATQEFSKLLSSVQIRVSAYKYFKKIMLSIRCKDCNKELIGHPTKTVSCGCPIWQQSVVIKFQQLTYHVL
jgi:hypothetical protein